MRYCINAIMNGNVVATNKKIKTMKEVDKYKNEVKILDIDLILDRYKEQVEEIEENKDDKELICSDRSRIHIKKVA